METVTGVHEKSPTESLTVPLKGMLDSIGFKGHADMQNAFTSTLKAGAGHIFITIHSKYKFVDARFNCGIGNQDLLFQQSFQGPEDLKRILEGNGIIRQFLKVPC